MEIRELGEIELIETIGCECLGRLIDLIDYSTHTEAREFLVRDRWSRRWEGGLSF